MPVELSMKLRKKKTSKERIYYALGPFQFVGRFDIDSMFIVYV